MDSSIPIPSKACDITPEWIQLVTGHTCLPGSISIEGDIQEGFGFLSSMFRVGYKTKTEAHSIIVKLLPSDPQLLDFTVSGDADRREILFYTKVLPDLLEILPGLQENVCKFYQGHVKDADKKLGTPRESILVMEDLKATGFEMMSLSGDPVEQRIVELVRTVARFHFAANAVSVKKGKSLPELYPFLQGLEVDVGWQNVLESLDIDGLPNLEKFLKEEGMDSVWEKCKQLTPLLGKIIQMVVEKGQANPSMIHTDVWPPNIMINEVLPTKIIDWQWLGYRDATYDLVLMIMSTMTKERLNKENVTELLRVYWEEYEILCESNKEFGGRVPRRKWEEFESTFFTWGCAWGYVWMMPGFAGQGFEKDAPKFAKMWKVLCEETGLVEFLLDVCKNKE